MEESNLDLDKREKQNRKLCSKIKDNDLFAETELLISNEPMIIQLASSMETLYDLDLNHWGGIDREDIIQEGRIAMLRAAQTFDENGGAKFSTYAYTIIKNAMTDLCRKGISAFEARMINSGLTQVFLDDDFPEKEFEFSVSDIVRHGRFDPTGNLAVLHVMLEKMNNRLKLLPPRQRRLLAYRYGLGALECKSISETAAYFHLTEKYVKIIEMLSLETLRAGMNDGKIV